MYNNNNICIYWWTNTHICSCLCVSKSKSESKSWLKMNHLMIITICRAEALNKDRNMKRSILSQQVFQISLSNNWFLLNNFFVLNIQINVFSMNSTIFYLNCWFIERNHVLKVQKLLSISINTLPNET
jgi:hypothetical protein